MCLNESQPPKCISLLSAGFKLQKEEMKLSGERVSPRCLQMNDDDFHLILFISEQHMDSCWCLTKLCNIMHTKGLVQSLSTLTRGVKKMSKLLTPCCFKYFKSMQHEPGLLHVPLSGQHSHLSVCIVCMRCVLVTKKDSVWTSECSSRGSYWM